MGFWDTAGRIGLGVATLGLSEAVPSGAWLGGAGREIDPNNARFTDRDAILGHLRGQYQAASSATAPQLGATPQLGRIGLGQASQIDPAQQAQFRQQQMAQASRLGQIATGQAQGAGELAAQRQAARQVAQQQAMARMGRGQPGLARAAARNVADIGVNAAGQAQVAALQDQQAANAQLGQILGQGREQDIGMAGQNAQLAQQRMLQQGAMDQQTMLQQGQMTQQQQLAQLQAELQQRGLNAQQQQAVLQQWMQMNQAELAARMGQEQTALSQPGLLGPLLQTGGQILAAKSDERAKRDVRDGGSDVDEMLDRLKPHSYRYKSGAQDEYTGGVGDGRRLAGIMAQALEASKAGKAIVHDTDKGKVIDVVGGLSAALASAARLNERLRALEAGR